MTKPEGSATGTCTNCGDDLGVHSEADCINAFVASARVGNDRLRAALKEALDGWDGNARALVDDPHHQDESRITELRKEFGL